MSTETPRTPTLGEIDRDGAISELLESTHGRSRAEFLRSLCIGSAALLGGLAAARNAEAGASPARDVEILNYGLTFEYMQAGFYTEADRVGTIGAMDERRRLWAETLGAHERAHVRILRAVLGRKAAAKPTFNYHGVTEEQDSFTRTAVAMEDLTVALLTGQAPRASTSGLRSAFFSLLTVEARHAAWARNIVGVVPVATAFDEPKTLAAVDRVVRSTRFISAEPKMVAHHSPRFTG
jgi:Ferritin-like domain